MTKHVHAIMQVRVELDPMPGVMHTPESARDVVAMLLTRNMTSYNPEVALIADDGIEIHRTVSVQDPAGHARVGDYIFVGGDLTVIRGFTCHAPGEHGKLGSNIVPELFALEFHTDFGSRFRGCTHCSVSDENLNATWVYETQAHSDMAGAMYEEKGEGMYSADAIAKTADEIDAEVNQGFEDRNVVSRGAW